MSSLDQLKVMYYNNSEKKLLGAGSFGHVYRVYDSKSSQVLAVKKIDLGLVESSEYKKVS